MKIAIAQISPKLGPINLDKHIEYINSSNADLIIFPELSMNGYKVKDALIEDAFDIEYFKQLKFNKDVVLGAAIKEKEKIFNSALYIEKSSNNIFIHNKVNLPNYGVFEESRFFFSGNHFFEFDTKFGKTGMFICEDMFNSETIDFISKKKLDLIIVIAASPAREFHNNGLIIEDQWNSILKSAAILSGGYVVFCNRVGFEDGLGFWGGSKIINPKAQIEKRAKYFEEDLIEIELDHNLSFTQKYFLRKN